MSGKTNFLPFQKITLEKLLPYDNEYPPLLLVNEEDREEKSVKKKVSAAPPGPLSAPAIHYTFPGLPSL